MVISTLMMVFPVAMVIAALTDLFTFKIPNKVTIALAATFFAWALAIAMPWSQLGWHLAIGAGVLVFGFTLFAFKVLGGGDAKLLAAAALWIGPDNLASFILLTAVLGGVLGIAILFYRSRTVPMILTSHPWAVRLHEKTAGMPYGIAIAMAGLWLFPTTVWVQAATA